jgi:hypothetical protein
MYQTKLKAIVESKDGRKAVPLGTFKTPFPHGHMELVSVVRTLKARQGALKEPPFFTLAKGFRPNRKFVTILTDSKVGVYIHADKTE